MTSNEASRTNHFQGSAVKLLLISVVFHFVFLNSIFDIYFKSPVTQGVGLRYGVGNTLEKGNRGGLVGEGLAKRVVLIVGVSLPSLSHVLFFLWANTF